MYSARLMSLFVAALFAALVVGAVITGCGGDDNGDDDVALTGTLKGNCVDAKTGLGVGGVQVALGNIVSVAGQDMFVQAGVSSSVTPDGAYVIGDIQPGTYKVLRLTPEPELYGPARDVNVNITIGGGQTITLAPLLILDEFPPNPVK